MKVKRHVKIDQCVEAVSILKDAFSLKLSGILDTDEEIQRVISLSLNRKEVLVVYSENKRVIGVAAYQYNNRISLAISFTSARSFPANPLALYGSKVHKSST